MAKSHPVPTPMPTDLAPAREVHEHKLPNGVTMTVTRRNVAPGDKTAPPEEWVGGYNSCGGCGCFLGNGTKCEECTPETMPSNIGMYVPARMKAK